MFGWIWEGLSKEARQAAGWAGLQSLPRELYLKPDGSLGNRPVQEIYSLREEQLKVHSPQVLDGGDYDLHVTGECLEIILKITPAAGRCGLKLACSGDGQEMTLVGYDASKRVLFIDRSRSSLSGAAQQGAQSANLEIGSNEDLELHVFLDRSVIEVFANERVSLTSRIYPTRVDSQGVKLFSESGKIKVSSLQIWQLKSIGLQEN